MSKFIHEVVIDIPRQHYNAIPNLSELVILKQELFYDYRAGQPSYQQLYEDTIRRVQDHSYERLKRGVELCNGPLILEFCLRHLADCGVPLEEQPYDLPYIEELLEDLAAADDVPFTTDTRTRRRIKHSTPILQQRALAACAWLDFRSHFERGDSGSLYAIEKDESMHRAAFTAHIAASIDFVPPIVLRIASWLRTVRARYPDVDIRTMPRFRDLTDLWRAWDAYKKWCIKRQIAEWYKVNTASNIYRCGGCDIQAMHKNAFRACGGNCPPEKKPHYCSKDCQERHWYIHRDVCHEGSAKGPVVKDNGDPTWVDLPEGYEENECGDVTLRTSKIWAERPGADICIDILHPSPFRRPDELIRIRSKTLSPEFLRYCRWDLERRINRLYLDVLPSNCIKRKGLSERTIKPRSARVGRTTARMQRIRSGASRHASS